MRRRQALWIVLPIIVLLSACTMPTAPLPTPAPTPLPAGTAAPVKIEEGVLVVYQKSGCFASINDMLTIYADGRLELVERTGNRRAARVAPDMLDNVRKLLAKPEYAALQARYSVAGADLCIYSITARDSAGKARTVTTMDAAKHPDILTQMIGELSALRAQIK
jgi:hypothetical protein